MAFPSKETRMILFPGIGAIIFPGIRAMTGMLYRCFLGSGQILSQARALCPFLTCVQSDQYYAVCMGRTFLIWEPVGGYPAGWPGAELATLPVLPAGREACTFS